MSCEDGVSTYVGHLCAKDSPVTQLFGGDSKAARAGVTEIFKRAVAHAERRALPERAAAIAALPEGSTQRKLAELRAVRDDQQAEEATLAAMRTLRDTLKFEVIIHGESKDGLPLPKRHTQEGYRALEQLVAAARGDGEMPAVALAVIPAPAAAAQDGDNQGLARRGLRQQRAGGAQQPDRVRIRINSQVYNVEGQDFATMLAAVRGLPGVSGKNFDRNNKLWDLSGVAGAEQALQSGGLTVQADTPAPAGGPTFAGDQASVASIGTSNAFGDWQTYAQMLTEDEGALGVANGAFATYGSIPDTTRRNLIRQAQRIVDAGNDAKIPAALRASAGRVSDPSKMRGDTLAEVRQFATLVAQSAQCQKCDQCGEFISPAGGHTCKAGAEAAPFGGPANLRPAPAPTRAAVAQAGTSITASVTPAEWVSFAPDMVDVANGGQVTPLRASSLLQAGRALVEQSNVRGIDPLSDPMTVAAMQFLNNPTQATGEIWAQQLMGAAGVQKCGQCGQFLSPTGGHICLKAAKPAGAPPAPQGETEPKGKQRGKKEKAAEGAPVQDDAAIAPVVTQAQQWMTQHASLVAIANGGVTGQGAEGTLLTALSQAIDAQAAHLAEHAKVEAAVAAAYTYLQDPGDLGSRRRLAAAIATLAGAQKCDRCGRFLPANGSHTCPADGLKGRQARLVSGGSARDDDYDPKSGYNSAGYNRRGYNREGLNAQGFDEYGYNTYGFDKNGYNRKGFNQHGFDRDGYNAYGFDSNGYNRLGFDAMGFNKQGFNKQGFDKDGFDKDGFDRQGFDRNGVGRDGSIHPFFVFDASGFGPDGRDREGYDRQGFRADGRSRDGRDCWGFFQFMGYQAAADGFDVRGLSLGHNGTSSNHDRNGRPLGYYSDGYDTMGYNREGFDRSGYNPMGFDKNGQRANGTARTETISPKTGKKLAAKYNQSGYDQFGYDAWGFNVRDGLSEPDAQGRRFNLWGLIYDAQRDICVDPNDPAKWMPPPHRTEEQSWEYRRWERRVKPKHGYTPPPATFNPLQPMTEDEVVEASRSVVPPYYVNSEYEQRYRNEYRERQQSARTPTWLVSEERLAHDEHARVGGIPLKCPKCGQFTGATAHICKPTKSRRNAQVYPNGAVFLDGTQVSYGTDHVGATLAPGEYNNQGYGYIQDNGYGESGYFDEDGYNQRGFRMGYDRDGFDLEGYDRDGYDRDGYNRKGYNRDGKNRQGQRRPPTLSEAGRLMDKGEDLVDNKHIAEMYSRIATSLVGKPRRVKFGPPGSGFATDMRGTIKADPNPYGPQAPARQQLLGIKAGIYHELGHEEFTDMGLWASILEIQGSDKPVTEKVDLSFAGLGVQELNLDAARGAVRDMFNVVEDGRMERALSDKYSGIAETLAADCMLMPRWGEEVGTGPDGQPLPIRWQLEGALLYTALPFFTVRDEVRAGMTPEARQLFEELEPMVAAAVRSPNPDDTYSASVYLAYRLQEAGLLETPQGGNMDIRDTPTPPGGTKARKPVVQIHGDITIDASKGGGGGGGESPFDVEFTGQVTIKNAGQQQQQQGDGNTRFRKKPIFEGEQPHGGGQSEGGDDQQDGQQGGGQQGGGQQSGGQQGGGQQGGGQQGGGQQGGGQQGGGQQGGGQQGGGQQGGQQGGGGGGGGGGGDEIGDVQTGRSMGGGSKSRANGRGKGWRKGLGQGDQEDGGAEDAGSSGAGAEGDEGQGGGEGADGDDDERNGRGKGWRKGLGQGDQDDGGEGSDGGDAGDDGDDGWGEDEDGDESAVQGGRSNRAGRGQAGEEGEEGDDGWGDSDGDGDGESQGQGRPQGRSQRQGDQGGQGGGEAGEDGDDEAGEAGDDGDPWDSDEEEWDDEPWEGDDGESGGDEIPSDAGLPSKGGSGDGSVGGGEISGGGGGGGPRRDAELPFTRGEADLADLLAQQEKEAAAALDQGVRMQLRPEALGAMLQMPLPDRERTMSVRLPRRNGDIQDVVVGLPKSRGRVATVKPRRTEHQKVAGKLSTQLGAIREQVEIQIRNLEEGDFDRDKLVDAYKGESEIYTQTHEMPATAFAASIQVDLSGSMGSHVQSAALYDATMVLSDTFAGLEIAHEVRGFSNGSFQFKALEEPGFEETRAAALSDAEGLSSVGAMGGTMYNTTGELAVAALASRKEKNRLMVVLSDGGFSDHGDSAHTLKHARNNGIITFGLFLGSSAPKEVMDQLYGAGNWACINSLTEMPKRVGERLAILYSNLVQQNRYG